MLEMNYVYRINTTLYTLVLSYSSPTSPFMMLQGPKLENKGSFYHIDFWSSRMDPKNSGVSGQYTPKNKLSFHFRIMVALTFIPPIAYPRNTQRPPPSL